MEQFDAYIKQIGDLQRKIKGMEEAEAAREKRRTISLTTLREDKDLANRVALTHGWCEIQSLSGELEEGIYLATFADDFKQVFESDGKTLTLMFTKDQSNIWEKDLDDEERNNTLEEIAYFFMASQESPAVDTQE